MQESVYKTDTDKEQEEWTGNEQQRPDNKDVTVEIDVQQNPILTDKKKYR